MSQLGSKHDVALQVSDGPDESHSCETVVGDNTDLNTAKDSSNSRWKILKQAPRFLLSQWFVIGYFVVLIITYFEPNIARRGGWLKAEYTFSYGALAMIFLISGLTMETRVLLRNLTRWKVHLITQGMCFIITPLVGLAIVEIIIASGNQTTPPIVLASLIVMVCTPTTVASNVAFTRQAEGDQEAALIEVTIANLAGILITPALIQLFLRPSLGLGAAAPTQSPTAIYLELIKHFGLALYLPLFVGQVARNAFYNYVVPFSQKVQLPKWASACLLLLLAEIFSDAFHSGAFKAIPGSSIILIIFLNIGLYTSFTLVCFAFCQPHLFLRSKSDHKPYLTKGQTTAVCFCGPQKSITVGLVLIFVQYGNFSRLEQAILSIPLALYQGLQILIAQIFIVLFRRWNRKDSIVQDTENG